MRILVTGGSGFIGTNLIDYLIKNKIELLNIDINPPQKQNQQRFWKECNILNKDKLLKVFNNYNPTHVVHLAARTDTEEKTIVGYTTNTEGTANVLEAIKATSSVQRVIITSTQFVYQSNRELRHDEDYAPYTIYGESKVISEQLTRKASLKCIWTIIRPTNVWGPWHKRYPNEFWFILKKGKYIHPGGKTTIRSYGYVGNVIYQIMKILKAPSEQVNRKLFYVGDKPIDLLDWVNGFSIKLTGHEVLIVPRFIVRTLGLLGDFFSIFGMKFPIKSSRYKSMTTNNIAPMDKTFALFGNPPYTMNDGINETVEWLIEQNPKFWARKDKFSH